MLYREPNTVGGYLSPACGGEKITSTQFFLIDKGILQWCAKGIVIKSYVIIPLAHQYLIAVIQRSWQGATNPQTLCPYVGEGLCGTPIYHICPVCLQKCGVSGG